ncbi:actin cross-linking domain-containing toxin [Streptomyces scabiei]|uniref:actin cross-linking domain-containing toxin n=1 Tax=Streptomyces scabiei TaxID=1930 RepID=UPI0036EB0286
MATSDEWSRVGFTGNPVTGNPGVLESITKELRDLGDLAGRVSGGLDSLLAKAEDGGFEGRTADALRTYVKDELKTYMANINRSFEMAADATARYARALGDAQARAENAADTVAALERVGGEPLAGNDPEMTRARGEVDAERDAVQAEAKILEDALHEAARLVSRPVKKPKKSFWKRFVATFFKVLEIVALVVTIVAAIIGGPLGLLAFGLGAVLFVKALVDYATGNGSALSLGLAFLGILFPSTKGLTTLGGLFRLGASGAKALRGALSASGRLLFRGGRALMSSPGRMLSLAGQGLVRFGGGLASRAGSGFMALPRVLSKTPAMVGSALRFMGGLARGAFRQGWSALSRDFYRSTAFVTGNMATKLGVFAVMGLGRLTATALLPMRYSEIARLGYRGAARMGFINRGLHFTPKSSGLLTRTGSLTGDLLDLPGRNLDRGGTLRPFDGTGSDTLAVPGTPGFHETLDELADISVAPVTAPRTPGFSSLPGPSPVRMPGRLDDLGVRLGALDDLDVVGLPVGTVPGGQRLGLFTPVNDRLRLLDPLDGRVGDGLLPPPTALDELRDLDALTGMERTPAGLLRPLDDLAGLSLDGRLGGLTESQVRQVLDGEIDLVRVTPDGVVLRIGKTDPIDVRVGLKDGVTIEALGPADPRVPTWSATGGAEGLDDLGIKLDDLTRLLPDTGDGSRTARDLLGLGPVRTDVAAPPATKPFTALTLRDVVTGGATGRLATERFQTWLRAQSAQLQLDTAGRRLSELDGLTDVPPLSRARAELDLSAARLDLNQARIAFDRLGMNLDTVRRDVVVMTARIDGPAAVLPTGELRLLDDLGMPTGRWITMEPGQNVTWVVRTDAGIVPDVQVRMADGGFTVTGPEGAVARFGADGRPDRLAFAADRSVDVQAIAPAPVWRATDETLWRIGGNRPLDQIFSEGFTVRDPLETNLDVMVRTGQPSAFVSTTTDRNLVRDGIYKFEIEASGGIDVGRTFERSMGPDAWRASGWASENAIAFPGGIASEFIRGAYRMDAQQNLLEWIPNPNFRGADPMPALAADLRMPGEGASGITGEGISGLSALDFQGLSLDDRLRLLDQLDLGGTRGFDGVGSPDGLDSLSRVGSLDGLDSPNALDSFGLDSPNTLDSLNRLDSFNGLDSLNRLDSPNGFDSLSRVGSLDGVGSGLDDLGRLSDDFRFDRFDAPAPRTDSLVVDPSDLTGVTGFRTEWQQTPLENGGFQFTDQTGDLRLVFDAGEVQQFTDIRLPGADAFVRFDADVGPGSLPRIVGEDGVVLPGGATIEPVRGALGVVTGVRVQALDGSWIGRFDLDGTRLSEQLTLSGPVGGPLSGARLSTTFTQLPGGMPSVTHRLTVPGLGDGAFDVVRLDGALGQRLPGGFSVTDSATGGRFLFDRAGRFVDLPVDGAPTPRLDSFGTTVPDTTARPVPALDGLSGVGSLDGVRGVGSLDGVRGVDGVRRVDGVGGLDGLGGNPSERLSVASLPGTEVLDDVASEVTGPLSGGERVSLEDLAAPAPPRVAPPPPAPPHLAPPPPAPPRVAPPSVPTATAPAHAPGAPVAPRGSRAVAPGFDSSFPAPSIGSESELGGFVVALPESADRTFAFVSKADTDEPLLMVTKDMSKGSYTNPADLSIAQRGNWQTHTVELITYPSRLGDQAAIGARNDATQWLLDVFKERLGGHNHRPLESMTSPDGLYRLQVTSDRHVIATGSGLELEGIPSVSMPTTQQQATIGIRAVDFGSRASQELRLLADHAHWYKPAFRDDEALRTALTREALDAPEQVENAYTYVKSVIDFTSDLVRRHGIPMEGWAGAPPYRGLTHPAVKNEWSVLPRTRPSLVLDALSPGDRALTLRLLREAPALGDEPVWQAARQYILTGNEVAGRGINNATVGGERALLFEFRSLPDELKGAVPHEKAPHFVVTDPLAELGGNRAAGVRRINDFVSGAENRDAFADWYRTEFPRDPDAARIHQDKGTDAILRMAAARHKAEWISLRHPQTWQDITTRPAAPAVPSTSAVPAAPAAPSAPSMPAAPAAPAAAAVPTISAAPSVPPLPPRVGAGSLPDGVNRPMTDLAGPGLPPPDLPRTDLDMPPADLPRTGPDIPTADLPRTPRTPGTDLPQITGSPDLALPRTTPAPDVGLPHTPTLTPDVSLPHTPAHVPGVREVPLSGLDDVAGLRLRVTEVPATDTAPASVRVEVLDFTAQGGPARLPDASVTVREGGGFTATGPQAGVRWHFDAAGRLEHRELPLTGTDFSLRFTDEALRPIRVTGPDGAPVPGAAVTPVRDASGALSELTVRVPLPGPDGPAAVWRFEPGGLTHSRELPLTLPGLDGPSGLGVKVTTAPGAGGTTTRVLELTGPPNLTGSFRLDPVGGSLSGRLPQGFTVTDSVTDFRFHFDHSGRLAYRDLPDPDGSGFLRFSEEAPDTAPTRLDDLDELDELGDVIGDGGHLPLAPESDAPGNIDLARIFDLTLDEAAGLRAAPGGSLTHLTDTAGALDLPPRALDPHAPRSPDLARLQGPADDVPVSPDRFELQRHAVTALDDYLGLPPATRVDDLPPVAQGAGGHVVGGHVVGGHVVGDFTVTPTPHGGPGGSHHTVHHGPTDVTLGFGPDRELRYQELFLRGGPDELDGLRVGVTGRATDGGPWRPDSFDFVGTRTADGFTLAPGTEVRGGLSLTDAAGTTTWHYGPDGVAALRDLRLPADRGVLRFDAGTPGGAPQVLDPTGRQLGGVRVDLLDEGRIALIPTGNGAHPLERTVFDPAGTLLEETVAVRGKGGVPTGDLWKIDHVSGTAVRTDTSGTAFTGRFDTASVERSATGQFRLTGAAPGKVTLFERETLRNGNVLHLSRDRFGQARWTEFDAAGDVFRHGRRIGDPDLRTFHDVPSGTWHRLLDNAGDVRTYTKASDGGLVRAEKGPGGAWTWQRFATDGTESLSGTRHWSWDHVGFRDTFRDPATGVESVAQRRGTTWPFGGVHGSRMYQEFSVVPGHAPAGGRIDVGAYTGHGLANAQVKSLETLSDGGSLLVRRFTEMRPPAFLWKSAAGRSPFDGFFRDLFAGDSLHRVSHWTQTAADGTTITGVRLNPSGANWVDIDEYGRVVRETRKLDDGHVVEIGRSPDDPTRWAPLPEYRAGGPYELSWRDATSGTTGTRHVDGDGRWRDVFTDGDGVERVRMRSEGRDSREYLFEAPSTRDLSLNDDAGTWVDRNSLLHITGRRDLIDGRFVESSGSPYRTSWTWREFSAADPATVVAEGVRRQNRGSLYSKTWDDSFVDLDRLGNAVRERNATDTGSSWVDAVRQSDGTWKWTKTAADGTVHSGGTRVYEGAAGGGRWRDLVDGQVVRERAGGGRVREFDYKILTPEPPTAPPTTGSLRELLAHAARQFEPPRTVEVNTQVWKEYDLGKVFRERVAVDGVPGRFREVDKQWGQWREFQDGRLVEQRTFTGRIWRTDAFGRLSTSGPAFVPEYLAGALPRMGDEVGLAGDTGWRLIGRETDFRGPEIEALGLLREVQDPWHGVLTGVRDGVSAEMPVWQRELRAALTSFTLGFVTDFTASLAITAATTGDGGVSRLDVYKALLSGTVGGSFGSGLNVLYNRTALGYLKTSMGARDWGGHPKQSMNSNTDDWATDWAAQEKATRWRNATYANTVGIATGALSGFVSTSISAAVFGVNGHDVKGADALLAGLWGAGASAFSGVTTGLAKNVFHLTTGARVFHKGGLPELGVNWGEAALTKYISWLITEAGKKNGSDLPAPGRAFPAAPPTTTTTSTLPTTPPSATAPQRPASDPAALLADGLEFP